MKKNCALRKTGSNSSKSQRGQAKGSKERTEKSGDITPKPAGPLVFRAGKTFM